MITTLLSFGSATFALAVEPASVFAKTEFTEETPTEINAITKNRTKYFWHALPGGGIL